MPNCKAEATDTLPDTGAACCRHHLIMRSIELDTRTPTKGIEIGRSSFAIRVDEQPERCVDGGPHDYSDLITGVDGDTIASARPCARCGNIMIDAVRLDS